MTLLVFSLRDAKTDSYSPPFFASTHGEAERNLLALLRDDKTLPARHPEDFALYHVGTWDPQKGVLEGLPIAKSVVSCINLLAANKHGPTGLAVATP